MGDPKGVSMTFFLRAARQTVLRVLPVLLVAGVAQASAIFNVTSTRCSHFPVPSASAALVIGGTDTLVANPLPASGGVQGAVLNGQCGAGFVSNGDELGASMYGDFIGSDMPLPLEVPVDFDFTILNPSGGSVDWYVLLDINKVMVYSVQGTSNSTVNPILGGGLANLLALGNQTPSAWRATVGLLCTSCDGEVTIDLGNSSLRINSPAAAVPEPSTISLLAIGAALLWFKRRSNKA